MARTKRTATPEPEEQGTALALPDEPILIAAYSDADTMESILKRIEQEVTSVVPDLSTVTSRKAIASTAYKVARSKTALDEVGKKITEDARKQIDTVNAKRRDVRERMDKLQKIARQPLDDWEAAEKARVDDLEDRLKDFSEDLPGFDASGDEIEKVLQEIAAIPIDDTWQEYKDRAAAAKAGTLNVLQDMLEKARQRAAEQAELERLRAEAAKREEEDRQRAAAERAKAEAERIEREKTEAAERAAKAAEERATLAAIEAEARHAREMEQAARRAEQAVEAERKRAADEQAKADAERKAREADQARRAEVRQNIAGSLRAMLVEKHPGDDVTLVFADWLIAGRIPHVKVEM